MALRSRLPIIGSALFLLLGAAAYFLPTFVPYLAINGINIVEQKDLIAIGFGAVAAVFLIISLFTGRKKSDDDEDSDETEISVEDVEAQSEGFDSGYALPDFEAQAEEYSDAPKAKLSAAEKRALKAAAKAEKKRQKDEAKFAKQAAKEAAKAAKAAAKAAKKGGVVAEGEILDAETGTDWYKDEDFLSQTVTETPVVEEAVEQVEETVEITDENWTDATYSDPNFEVPFAEETIETVEAIAEDEIIDEAPVNETPEAETDNTEVAELKAKIAALEAALTAQSENTQLALLELSEATRSNSTARLEWLKDMVEKNNFGDDVVLRMIDMLIRQSKTDEGTVQSALSAIDLNK